MSTAMTLLLVVLCVLVLQTALARHSLQRSSERIAIHRVLVAAWAVGASVAVAWWTMIYSHIAEMIIAATVIWLIWLGVDQLLRDWRRLYEQEVDLARYVELHAERARIPCAEESGPSGDGPHG